MKLSLTCCFALLYFLGSGQVPKEGLALWLSADTGVVTENGFVKEWMDRSGNNNHAAQANANKQPLLINPIPEINNNAALRFDGVDDFVEFGELNAIRTVFMVLKHASGSSAVPQSIMGHATKYDFLGFADTLLFNYYWLNQGIKDGTVTIDGEPEAYDKICKPRDFSILEIVSKAPLSAQYLSNDRNIGGYWQGDYAEILLYDVVLDSAQRANVELYLRKKYFPPPVELGANKLIGKGDSAALDAGYDYSRFKWNTGDTTRKITVEKTGSYSVSVVDSKGFPSSDRVQVLFAGIPHDSTICLGDTLVWDTGLPGEDYSFAWSDGSSDTVLAISNGGNYYVQIIDTIGIRFFSDTLKLLIDSFPIKASLGNDTTLCLGNKIKLANHNQEIKSYMWSNDSTASWLPVSISGTYSLVATDVNECTIQDTINITIKGSAPIVNFDTKGLCANNVINFTDISESTDSNPIITWSWIINNDTLQGQNQSYIFKQSGEYIIKQFASTNECTGDNYKQIRVFTNPRAIFYPQSICSDIDSYIWSSNEDNQPLKYAWFIDNSFIGNEEKISINKKSNFNIKFIVSSSIGCTDSITKQIEVKQSPQALITHSPACKDQPIFIFDNSTIYSPLIERKWFVNNIYKGADDVLYESDKQNEKLEVKLEIKSVSGCSDTSSISINIKEKPSANFLISDSCTNEEVIFTNNSISTDPLVLTRWKIGDNSEEYTQNPSYSFSQTGDVPVTLIVSTDEGCTDTIRKTITINPSPISLFSFYPDKINGAPTEISFTNNSTNASYFEWNFDDNQTSSEKNPTHEYHNSGNYTISLLAKNEYGCKNSSSRQIILKKASYSIEIIEVKTTSNAGYYSTTVTFANKGVNEIKTIDFTLTNNVGSIFKERWSGEIFSGEIQSFTLSSQVKSSKDTLPDYICIDAEAYEKDSLVAKDTKCISNVNGFSIFNAYPIPADEKIAITLSIPEDGATTLDIYDYSGKLAKSDAMTLKKGYNTIDIPTSHLNQGLYFLQITFREIQETIQIVVIHKKE